MKYSINLLTKKQAPIVDRLVYFSLNYLRYIIILTQLVVIAVFFYRFQIDQHIIDLKESVDQKKEIVQVVLPLLNEAATIDSRTSASQTILQKQTQFSQMVSYLTSVFPASMTLTKFEFDGNTLMLSGNTIDVTQLQAFYQLLNRDKKFATINLQSIKRTDIGYTFILAVSQFKAV